MEDSKEEHQIQNFQYDLQEIIGWKSKLELINEKMSVIMKSSKNLYQDVEAGLAGLQQHHLTIAFAGISFPPI